jgi:phenylalanyl-tRNA synthetase beta chain
LVPAYRSDIETQNDLAEEIARIIGYDNIAKNELSLPKLKASNNNDIENKLRYLLLDNGFYEVINSPFISHSSNDSIIVDNPLDSNKKYLRTTMIDSLLDNLTYNERRQKDSIKLFEISDIYSSNNNEINKNKKLAIVASGRAGHNYKDFSIKITKKYLTEMFKETLPNADFNFQKLTRDSLKSKIKNEVIGCEVDIDNFSSDLLNYNQKFKPSNNFIEYSPISDLPYSIRDLSFSIKDFTKRKQLEDYILKFKDELLKDVYIFDYFHNERNAEIKIGFRLVFQSSDSTITELQVNDIISDIIGYTQKIKGITLPGLK